MIADARSLEHNQTVYADACIIGAGAAGIALARALAELGRTVVLVESGAMRSRREHETRLSALDDVGVASGASGPGRHRGFGGTTRLWFGQCIELDDLDFEQRPWIEHSGWPISKARLIEPYRRARHFFGLNDYEEDERQWVRFGVQPPAFDPTDLAVKFTSYAPHVDLAARYGREIAASDRVRTIVNGTIVALRPDPEAPARMLALLRSSHDRCAQIRAGAYVICAGGIETPRLLLSSTAHDGAVLGNQGGMLGRMFAEHPNAVTGIVRTNYPRRVQRYFNLFYRDRVRFFPKVALSAGLQERERLLNANGHLVYEFPETSGIAAAKALVRSMRSRRLEAPPRQIAAGMLRGPAELTAILWRRYAHGRAPIGKPVRIFFQAYTEQAPDLESRITLSDESDRFGMRRVRLDWRVSDRERATLQGITAAADRQFRRTGLGSVEPWGPIFDGGDWRAALSPGYHHSGTTRMADDPSNGVVDTECRVFGTDDVYVASGSVFPTSGYANPTLTIVALALRVAGTVAGARRP